MKIKHFAGYGSVDAKKVLMGKVADEFGCKHGVLKVKVSGMHECGLVRTDHYDLFGWLLQRFDKSLDSYTCIESVDIESAYERGRNGQMTDTATYTFKYKLPGEGYIY